MSKNIHRSRFGSRVVSAIAIDASGTAILRDGANGERAAVAAQRHGVTELIAIVGFTRVEKLSGKRVGPTSNPYG